jgi:hypothetical protein
MAMAKGSACLRNEERRGEEEESPRGALELTLELRRKLSKKRSSSNNKQQQATTSNNGKACDPKVHVSAVT